MQLLPADYVLCGITIVMAALGFFRGCSGTLAFVLATAAAACVATFGWTYSASFATAAWARAAGTLVGALLAFGLVRYAVKKFVNGLLAQPSDAIFGFAIGALCGLLLLLVWAHSGIYLEYSNLAKAVAAYV